MKVRPFFLLLIGLLYTAWAIPSHGSLIGDAEVKGHDQAPAFVPTSMSMPQADEMWLVDAKEIRHLRGLNDRLHGLQRGCRPQPASMMGRTLGDLQAEIAYHKESSALLSQIQAVVLKAQPHPVPSPQRYILLAEGAFCCGGCIKSCDLSAEYDLVARHPSMGMGLLAGAQVSFNLLLSALRQGKVEADILNHTRALHLQWQGPASDCEGTSSLDHADKTLPLGKILGFFPNLHSIAVDRDMPLTVLEAIRFSMRAHYGEVYLNLSQFFEEDLSVHLHGRDLSPHGGKAS
ncbi:MAG: hypothetical protein ACK5O7_06930 [Holosporales bacterium]